MFYYLFSCFLLQQYYLKITANDFCVLTVLFSLFFLMVPIIRSLNHHLSLASSQWRKICMEKSPSTLLLIFMSHLHSSQRKASKWVKRIIDNLANSVFLHDVSGSLAHGWTLHTEESFKSLPKHEGFGADTVFSFILRFISMKLRGAWRQFWGRKERGATREKREG